MKLNKIIAELENVFPLSLQESYDNAGMQVYGGDDEINAALITLDVTQEVVDEAIAKKCNLIISHHPLIFGGGLKKITGKNPVERIVMQCIKHSISVYSAHTNCDNSPLGTSKMMCEKLGIKNYKVLSPALNRFVKIAVYVPENFAEKIRQAIFEAGGGATGNYSCSSFNTNGQGSFKPEEGANPYVGTNGELHFENEVKIETICQTSKINKIISAITAVHPYEEPAIDIIKLENQDNFNGSGAIGKLEKPEKTIDFLKKIKEVFGCGCIKHTKILKPEIQTIAICSGSGSFLLNEAIRNQADIFISGDFTYHKYFDADNKITIVDIGHYESEIGIKQIFYDILTKKICNFEVRISEQNTNPINYL